MRKAYNALNGLCKWRAAFAGWQLGTRPKGDPESDAVRDHREATICLRAEVSAIAVLLIQKGVFTSDEWEEQLVEEADALHKLYQQKFPGFLATEAGLEINVATAAKTTKGWRP